MFYRHNTGNHGHQMWAVRRYGSQLAKLTGLSQREVNSIMSDFLLYHITPIIHNTTSTNYRSMDAYLEQWSHLRVNDIYELFYRWQLC